VSQLRLRAFQFLLTDQQLPLPTQKKEREVVWFKLVGCAHQLEPHHLPLKNWGGVGINRRTGKPCLRLSKEK